MGLYTILKPCLKGENINITKNNLKFNFFFFLKKLKIFSGDKSFQSNTGHKNNTAQLKTGKWLSSPSQFAFSVSICIIFHCLPVCLSAVL